MFSSIDRTACAELRLPAPRLYQDQPSYVIYCLSRGHEINTRICRYIGIANLNSVRPVLTKKNIPFTKTQEAVWDPKEKRVDPKKVIVLRMDKKQQKEYLSNITPAKA